MKVKAKNNKHFFIMLSLLLFSMPFLSDCGPRETHSAKSIVWKPCADAAGFDCSFMAVPLDYNISGDEQIKLSLARLPCRNADKRIGSLLINMGGPGVSGTSYLKKFFENYEPYGRLRERFDLVSWDPRGTGDSEKVVCTNYLDEYYSMPPIPETPEQSQARINLSRNFAEKCMETSGRILSYVDTVSTARDMYLIRAALGDGKATYLGFSYGTLLGAVYAELFPNRVRAFVLDAAVDPSLEPSEIVLQSSIALEEGLNTFLSWCASNPDCEFHSDGDPFTAYDNLFDRIKSQPLPAKGGRVMGIGLFHYAIGKGLIYTPGWDELAPALAEAAEYGDASLLLEMADSATGRYPDGRYLDSYLGPESAIACLDNLFPDTQDELDNLYMELAVKSPRTLGWTEYGWQNCPYWPVPSKVKPHRIRAEGAETILVVGSTGDPISPYAWSVALADQLENSVLLTRDGYGHTTFGSGNTCSEEAISDYLIDLKIPDYGTICR